MIYPTKCKQVIQSHKIIPPKKGTMVYNTEAQNIYSKYKPAAEGHRQRAMETKSTGDINASAEAFIKRFRRQLFQQWMESSMEKN